jgi:tetratricopeptide (TPR) repeat protein
MNEKASSAQHKALQERKRGHFDKAVKRLEQAIAQFPDELDLYLDAVDACLEGGEVMQATNFLKTAQEKFVKDKDRVGQFVREKLFAVHDPALARYVIENAVKRRELDSALEHLGQVPDHVARDLLARTKTKKQSLKSANGGGYSLRSEIFTNDLLSALLSIRLGNVKDGMAALVQILDEKPVEQKMLLPFLAGLEAKEPKVGRIRFAHGCALWLGGNEIDAIARFVETARLDPTAIGTCIERLKSLRGKTKFHSKVERALAEILLLKDDFDEAAAVLRAYLADNKDNGREVIMLLKPFLDPAHGLNECVWVALDAALSLDQSAAAMEILRPLHQRGSSTPDIYARLQEKSQNGSFASEIMLFHASLALELKDFARAAEILTAVAATSPQDAHAVLGMADKHRSAHPVIEELCRKLAQPEATEAVAEEEPDFQSFDNKEFSFHADGKTGGERPAAAPRASAAPNAQKPASRFGEEGKKPEKKRSFVEDRELSFDDDGTPAPPSTDAPVPSASDEDDAGVFETARDLKLSEPRVDKTAAKSPAKPAEPPLGKLFTDSDYEPAPRIAPRPAPKPATATTPKPATAPTPKPATAPATPGTGAGEPRPAVRLQPSAPAGDTPADDTTEAHVQNVGAQLGKVGAAAFFHIDGSDGERSSTASVTPVEPEAPKTFDSELARFRKGELDNAAVITLIEQAVEDLRVNELHDLLTFRPQDDAERFAQRFYEAEYHVLSSRPLPALEILIKLGDSPLTEDQKQRVWLRTAACQRSMNDFAGANETLKRLTDAFPGRPEYDRLARRNHEQLLGAQSNDVAVLQKTTSLD